MDRQCPHGAVAPAIQLMLPSLKCNQMNTFSGQEPQFCRSIDTQYSAILWYSNQVSELCSSCQ